MRWRQVAATAAAALLFAGGCARPARRVQAPVVHYRCAVPFNAGSRIPGVLNPAYPRSGLYPASGGVPPAGAPGVTLRVRATALVLSYGQPLAATGTRAPGSVTTARAQGDWWEAPLAAGFTFRLFGPTIPVFGVLPGPLVTGPGAARARYVWMVTQWDAVQTLTVLRGDDALAAAAQPPRFVPAVVTAQHDRVAAAYVRQAEVDGWRAAGTYRAEPACGASAAHLSPFGARAALKLPLGVPLQLVSPEFGGVVMEITAGG